MQGRARGGLSSCGKVEIRAVCRVATVGDQQSQKGQQGSSRELCFFPAEWYIAGPRAINVFQ